MISILCDQDGHQDCPITALCLRQDCTIKSACCMICMKLHTDCIDHLKLLENVTKEPSQFKTLRNSDLPTITSLNRLGQMLKNIIPQEMQDMELQKKQILQDLKNIKDIVVKRNEQSIDQKAPVILTSKDKQFDEEYFQEGYELYMEDKDSIAIEYFNKALRIDKNHVPSLYWKGRSLSQLDKDQEASV